MLQIFLVYWQKTKSLEKLINLCHAPQASAGVQDDDTSVRTVTAVAITAVVFLVIGGAALLVHYFGFYKTLLPQGIFHVS